MVMVLVTMGFTYDIYIYICTWPWRWLPDNAVNSSFGICPCRWNLCNGRSTRRLPMTSTGNWGTWPNSWPTSSSTWSSTFPWAAGAPGGKCHCLLTRFTGPYSIPTDKLMHPPARIATRSSPWSVIGYRRFVTEVRVLALPPRLIKMCNLRSEFHQSPINDSGNRSDKIAFDSSGWPPPPAPPFPARPSIISQFLVLSSKTELISTSLCCRNAQKVKGTSEIDLEIYDLQTEMYNF